MLARVKWNSNSRYDHKTNQAIVEHGTLLGFDGSMCMIAMDGYSPHSRGKIVRVESHIVTVTTQFKWSEENETQPKTR